MRSLRFYVALPTLDVSLPHCQAQSIPVKPRISLTRSPKHIATMHIVRKGSGMLSSTFLNSSTESAFGSLCLFEPSFTRTRLMGLC